MQPVEWQPEARRSVKWCLPIVPLHLPSVRQCVDRALGSRACIMSSTLYNSLDDGFRCSSCLTSELTTFWLKGAICISGAESVLAVLLAQDLTRKFIGTCGAHRKSTE